MAWYILVALSLIGTVALDFVLGHYSLTPTVAAVLAFGAWGWADASIKTTDERIDELQREIRMLTGLQSREEPETGIFEK